MSEELLDQEKGQEFERVRVFAAPDQFIDELAWALEEGRTLQEVSGWVFDTGETPGYPIIDRRAAQFVEEAEDIVNLMVMAAVATAKPEIFEDMGGVKAGGVLFREAESRRSSFRGTDDERFKGYGTVRVSVGDVLSRTYSGELNFKPLHREPGGKAIKVVAAVATGAAMTGCSLFGQQVGVEVAGGEGAQAALIEEVEVNEAIVKRIEASFEAKYGRTGEEVAVYAVEMVTNTGQPHTEYYASLTEASGRTAVFLALPVEGSNAWHFYPLGDRVEEGNVVTYALEGFDDAPRMVVFELLSDENGVIVEGTYYSPSAQLGLISGGLEDGVEMSASDVAAVLGGIRVAEVAEEVTISPSPADRAEEDLPAQTLPAETVEAEVDVLAPVLEPMLLGLDEKQALEAERFIRGWFEGLDDAQSEALMAELDGARWSALYNMPERPNPETGEPEYFFPERGKWLWRVGSVELMSPERLEAYLRENAEQFGLVYNPPVSPPYEVKKVPTAMLMLATDLSPDQLEQLLGFTKVGRNENFAKKKDDEKEGEYIFRYPLVRGLVVQCARSQQAAVDVRAQYYTQLGEGGGWPLEGGSDFAQGVKVIVVSPEEARNDPEMHVDKPAGEDRPARFYWKEEAIEPGGPLVYTVSVENIEDWDKVYTDLGLNEQAARMRVLNTLWFYGPWRKLHETFIGPVPETFLSDIAEIVGREADPELRDEADMWWMLRDSLERNGDFFLRVQ